MTLADQNIETLIVHCKQGNQLAQMEVYNRYSKAMYNVAIRIVKDQAEAEDVMQESFITAFDKLDSFKGEATFGAWLKRIVVNNSLTQYRKNNRYQVVSTEDMSLQEPQSEDIETEDLMGIKAREVLECMKELHPSYAQVLTLHFIEGYDYEEIGDIMDISYGNCRTMVSRAKNSLRKKLKLAV